MVRLLLTFVVLLYSVGGYAAERVKWEQGQEIGVELKVNVERKIIFPEKVRFAVKARYANQFKHSLIDNMMYITPVVEFTEKLTVQGLDSGRFYVLQASVSEGAVKASDDLVIHISDTNNVPEQGARNGNRLPFKAPELTPMDLVQYAAQSLYAPSSELIEPTPGVRRVVVKQRALANLYRGGALQSEVLASWTGGGLYVTALKLVNISTQPVTFEPCRIRGDFYSATPQFKYAMPAGHKKDFTVVYLLSEKPFDVAVQSRELLCV
jgi:integrating conjugative element protein (TIGR03749 family)